MEFNNLPSMNEEHKVSPWEKPGGTLGKIVAAVAAVGGCMLLYSVLPFLITLASNIITLAALVGVIAGLGFLLTNKKFQELCSNAYFMLMRKLTGLIIEIDPIAIVRKKILEMKKKIQEIQKHMGTMRGLMMQSEKELAAKKEELMTNFRRLEVYNKQGDKGSAAVAERQIVRLKEAVERRTARLEESKKWYAILQQLKRAADLTVEDTENEVKEREDEYRSIKEQHKAFSSMMSILKGDPDQMETFTRAMDYMADDISQRLGEMTTVIEETGGILSQINVDNAVASARADELLKRYETYGIDGLFSSSKKESASSSKFGTSASDAVFSEGPEPEKASSSSGSSSSERRYF